MQKIFKWLMLIGSLSMLAVCIAHAAGQETTRPRMTPQLALATLSVSEAGWEADVDMRGIHAVILRTQARAPGSSYVRAASMYSKRLIGRQGPISRPWLWGLNPRGTEPDQWPDDVWMRARQGTETVVVRRDHAPWSAFRERWNRTYVRAGEVSEYTLENWDDWAPCESVPDDWGGDMDLERAQRLGLIPIACDGSINHFFVRPSTLAEQLGG